jgi:hypothetical protein
VLSLTGYQTPDVLGSVYVAKALQVMNEDNRQRIISRRVITPKGETDGGGGGQDAGAGTIRRDFRVLAFWLGSVTTDARGHATADVKLPESLTTYRIMAVAADRASRFGSADAEIRINKPVTLKAAFPRFLAVGDKATFGAVVTSQLAQAGAATVTIASLDPDVMQFADLAPRTLDVPADPQRDFRIGAIADDVATRILKQQRGAAGAHDAARSRLEQARRKLRERRLPAAVRTGEGDDLASPELERESFDRGDAGRVRVRDVAQPANRFR